MRNLVRVGMAFAGAGVVLAMLAGGAWASSGLTAYVTNVGGGTVTPISTATNTPGTAIPVGTQPIAVAITPDGKTAYVTNDLVAGTVTPGTTFSFALIQPAHVSLAFTQSLRGHRINGRCVIAQSAQKRKHRSCQRTVLRGTLGFTAHPGVNKIAFQGRISPTRRLKPGRYTLAITATNPARQHSNTKRLSFTIVK